MRVGEAMSRDVVTISADASLTEAAETMRKHGIGLLPVVAADAVVGVLTDRDVVVRGVCYGVNTGLVPVRYIMSTELIWCFDDDVLTAAADVLADNQVRRLLVFDRYKSLVGLLSLDDLAARMSSDRLLGDVLRHVAA